MSNNYLTIKLDKKALVSATTGQSDPNTTNTSNTWDIFFALALKANQQYVNRKKGSISFKQEIAQNQLGIYFFSQPKKVKCSIYELSRPVRLLILKRDNLIFGTLQALNYALNRYISVNGNFRHLYLLMHRHFKQLYNFQRK